jgi:hypothetical protein
MYTTQIESAGMLEIFGPGSKPWRVANQPFLKPAIELAGTDPCAAVKLAQELVNKEGICGIVRFRCEVLVNIAV